MFGGGRFWPLEPERSAFNIADIARGLSNACRYNGQVLEFYSVAEHSVYVSRIAERRARAQGLDEDTVLWVARWGLLHDASEAHLSDIARPVKHTAKCAGYRELEAATMKVIAERFGLGSEEPSFVREVDAEILGSEVEALLPNAEKEEWGKTCPGGVLYPPIPGLKIHAFPPKKARRFFLRRYETLFGLLPVSEWTAAGILP
jgi:5'-deoxynucleotidase YfbR-like HD superfamily hydrolase